MKNDNIDYSEIDIFALIGDIWRGKFIIALFMIVGIALGAVQLRNATYKYTVTILLSSVESESGSSNFNAFGGLASLAGISLPSSNSSDYTKFRIMLKSEEIAASLMSEPKLVQDIFSNEWDDELKQFRRPNPGNLGIVVNQLRKILTGRDKPIYLEPNAARLARHIDKAIDVYLNPKTQILTITAEDSNPKFSEQLILNLIRKTDESFKQKFIERGSNALKFYQIKISKARSQEHREVLAKLIAKEEQKLMLASQNGLFVVDILTGPNTSIKHTSPRASKTLIFCMMLGMAFGMLIIIIRHMKQKR